MAILQSCCCCIPLRIGCIIIAVLFILIDIDRLIYSKETLKYLGPEENEDEENKSQKRTVFYLVIFRILLCVLSIIVAIAVIFAVYMKIPIILKAACSIVAILSIVKFFFDLITSEEARTFWISLVLPLFLRLYFATVWYSYGQYIEEERERLEVSYVSTYNSSSGQLNTMEAPPPYDVSKSDGGRRQLGPYGNWSQHPYFTSGQGGQNTYSPSGTQSAYALPTTQRHPLPSGSYPAQGIQSAHALPGTQAPYPYQQPQSDMPHTPMPQPYSSSPWKRYS